MYHGQVVQLIMVHETSTTNYMGNGAIRPDSFFTLQCFALNLFRLGMTRTGMFRPYILFI